MDTLAIKGTVTNLKGPIADRLNSLGQDLRNAYLYVDFSDFMVKNGNDKKAVQCLSGALANWIDRLFEAQELFYAGIRGLSEDDWTDENEALSMQICRIEQQIALYYQAAFKMLTETGGLVAHSLPRPVCIFPDDAGPDDWEFLTADQIEEIAA